MNINYHIEAVGTMYFNGFEPHKVKIEKTLGDSEFKEITNYRQDLRQHFPDLFEGILDCRIVKVICKNKKKNNKYITITEIETVKEFSDLEHNYLFNVEE